MTVDITLEHTLHPYRLKSLFVWGNKKDNICHDAAVLREILPAGSVVQNITKVQKEEAENAYLIRIFTSVYEVTHDEVVKAFLSEYQKIKRLERLDNNREENTAFRVDSNHLQRIRAIVPDLFDKQITDDILSEMWLYWCANYVKHYYNLESIHEDDKLFSIITTAFFWFYVRNNKNLRVSGCIADNLYCAEEYITLALTATALAHLASGEREEVLNVVRILPYDITDDLNIAEEIFLSISRMARSTGDTELLLEMNEVARQLIEPQPLMCLFATAEHDDTYHIDYLLNLIYELVLSGSPSALQKAIDIARSSGILSVYAKTLAIIARSYLQKGMTGDAQEFIAELSQVLLNARPKDKPSIDDLCEYKDVFFWTVELLAEIKDKNRLLSLAASIIHADWIDNKNIKCKMVQKIAFYLYRIGEEKIAQRLLQESSCQPLDVINLLALDLQRPTSHLDIDTIAQSSSLYGITVSGMMALLSPDTKQVGVRLIDMARERDESSADIRKNIDIYILLFALLRQIDKKEAKNFLLHVLENTRKEVSQITDIFEIEKFYWALWEYTDYLVKMGDIDVVKRLAWIPDMLEHKKIFSLYISKLITETVRWRGKEEVARILQIIPKPKDVKVLIAVGNAYLYIGQNTEAWNSFAEALNLIQSENERQNTALYDIIQHIIAICDGLFKIDAAECFYVMEQAIKEERGYHKSFARSDERPRVIAHFSEPIAHLYALAGKKEKALSAAKQAIKEISIYDDILKDIASVFMQQNDVEGVRQVVSLLQDVSFNIDAKRAEIFAYAGDYESATRYVYHRLMEILNRLHHDRVCDKSLLEETRRVIDLLIKISDDEVQRAVKFVQVLPSSRITLLSVIATELWSAGKKEFAKEVKQKVVDIVRNDGFESLALPCLLIFTDLLEIEN